MRFDGHGGILKEPTCYMQDGGGVLCSEWQKDTKICDNCGWNPWEAQRRSAKIREKLNMVAKKDE